MVELNENGVCWGGGRNEGVLKISTHLRLSPTSAVAVVGNSSAGSVCFAYTKEPATQEELQELGEFLRDLAYARRMT